jgi:rubredoxin
MEKNTDNPDNPDKKPTRLEDSDETCPVCGSDNIGFWDDGAMGYRYCANCFVTFVPTTEWTEVPDNAICPSGDYEYRLELGGKKYGRIHPTNNGEEVNAWKL